MACPTPPFSDSRSRISSTATSTRLDNARVSTPTIAERVRALDWRHLSEDLDVHGYALTPRVANAHLLRSNECDALIRLFGDDERYRNTVDMRRLRFGSGTYRYFKSPLPAIVQALRKRLYPPLARIANSWAERLGDAARYPKTLSLFLEHCHENGQKQPTPLIFRYQEGDYNAFHQDVYGKIGFPFQVLTVLSRHGEYSGGEFMLYKLRPRSQSLGQVVTPARGQMLIFPNRYKPEPRAQGGYYRAELRHGVSRLHSGRRYSLGIIFHDAEK